MKKILYLLVLFAVSAYAQTSLPAKINMEQIKKEITDKNGPFYYSNLKNRFLSLDTTLNAEDYKHIYYGFAFDSNYNALSTENDILRKTAKENNFNLLRKEAEKIINKNPANLKALYYLGYAINQLDSNDYRWKVYLDMYYDMMNVIAKSGDGFTPETAIKVIFVSDEYELIYRYYEMSKSKGQTLEGNYDVLKVEPNEYYKKDKIYFDISEELESEAKAFKINK